MNKSELKSAATTLAAEAGLRRVTSRYRSGTTWVGIASGICIVMSIDSVRLHIEFLSPEADDDSDATPDDDDIAADTTDTPPCDDESSAFRRAAEAGLPVEWLEQIEDGPWGFHLRIDDVRRRSLASQTMDGIVGRIVDDLHDLGAEPTLPCSECGRPATQLGLFESMSDVPTIIPYCDPCWDDLQQQTRGAIRVNHPVTPFRGWLCLLAATLAFIFVWGYAQHPALEVPLPLLLIGCTAGGLGVAMATAWLAGGSNWSLRIGVAVGILSATLLGNILGVKLLLEGKGFILPWSAMIPAYFTEYLPAHLGQEILFLSGGVVGVVIGFVMMRESERIRVR